MFRHLSFCAKGILSVLAGAALLAPCTHAQESENPPEATPAPARSPSKEHTFYGDIRRDWRARDFAGVDAIIDRVARQRSRDKYGRLDLQEAMAALAAEAPKRVEGWTDYLAEFDQWQAAQPNSAFAAVAKGEALITYAWNARGGGSAGEVSKEGWQLFFERLAQAHAVLASASPTAARNPHWYASTIRLARGEQWPRAGTEALAQQAIAQAPWYDPTYMAMTAYLLPRWGGKLGDWQAFALKATDGGGVEGALTYARIVDFVATYYSSEEMFLTPYPIDWSRARAGFAELTHRYPDDFIWRHFCREACMAGDRDQARDCFSHHPFDAQMHPFSSEGEVAAWQAWSAGGALPPVRAQQDRLFETWKALKAASDRPAAPPLLSM